jgi:recombination protein RecT
MTKQAERIRGQAETAMTRSGERGDLISQITKMIPQLNNAVAKGIDVNSFARAVQTEVRKVPRLANCKPASFFGALFDCAQLGLKPGPFGHVYLIPYGDECTLVIGYKGLVELVYRSGKVSAVKAVPIYVNENFDWDGMQVTNHKPLPPSQRGEEIVAVYTMADMIDGNRLYEFMWKEEIDAIMKRAASSKGRTSPWQTDYIEMAKKTVLRRMCKLLPLSPDVQHEISRDERISRYDASTGEVIDVGSVYDLQPPKRVEEEPEPEPEAADENKGRTSRKKPQTAKSKAKQEAKENPPEPVDEETGEITDGDPTGDEEQGNRPNLFD